MMETAVVALIAVSTNFMAMTQRPFCCLAVRAFSTLYLQAVPAGLAPG